ncbi:hypothetical protein FOMG_00993 [Fusarium oxysporum f. sp. melonis 26406]|uniref:2EXR domain-containing protein n=1 Tax=Fusarium oxysporum f. sp. melonis 26406 TaxID=1089452 RepID=X0BS36_FUSOX|nr:hypothetical protein FOMG_00993 [Fusarium oxysporum f. sp. melonis 26406]KAJ9428988.1 hypothetical protein QL093DRAFT_2092195 [Fusarium oxysporum]
MSSRQPLIEFGLPLQGHNAMPSLVPSPSLSSKIYKAVISPFQKLQLLFPRVSGTFDVNFTAQDARRLLRLKAEIGGPSKEFDTTNCATTTFHKFDGLPVDLRTMTWRLSFRKARIFRLGPMSKDLDILWLSFTISHKAPASAQACRESRALFQAEALQLFGQNIGVYRSLWFLPSLDIFYWNRYNISPGNVPGGDIPCFQNKVLFAARHHPLPDTDVRFTKVKEDDDINIEYEEDWWQWGHIWPQLIASVARQKWRQWRLCLFAMKLTPLEPVLEYVQE